MTKIPHKPKKRPKYSQNLKIDQNTPKPKKWPKYLLNLKITKITPPKPKKGPKYHLNLKMTKLPHKPYFILCYFILSFADITELELCMCYSS